MKKILFLSLALLVTGTMYADKKCCKDKSTCSHSEAKACNHGQAKAEVNDDGTPKEAHAGCAHAKASGARLVALKVVIMKRVKRQPPHNRMPNLCVTITNAKFY